MATLSSAQNNVEAAGRKAASTMADTASDLASKASHQFDKVVDSAESTVRSVADQGREASERVGEVAGNFRGAVQKSVSDQPMATLFVAAAAGFVLGALWKS